MLSFKIDDTFQLLVEIPVPGKPAEKVEFTVLYQDADALAEWIKTLGTKPDVEFLEGFVKGWNPKHVDLPFSAESLAKLLKAYPGSGTAIITAYHRESHGIKEKN